MRSTRSRVAATISSISSVGCWPASRRRHKCRPTLALAAVNLAQQTAILKARRRSRTSWSGLRRTWARSRAVPRPGTVRRYRLVEFLQHNASCDARRRRRSGDSPQRGRSAERDIEAARPRSDFTNVTGIACTTASNVTIAALQRVDARVAECAPNTYFFANGAHPTTAGHRIIADYAISSMITGPQQIATLVEAPFAVEDANFRALDGRMWSSLGAPRTQKKLEAWAAYDYGSSDMSAGLDQRQRQHEHDRRRRRHEGLRQDADRGHVRLYGREGRLRRRGRRLQAAPAHRDDVRRLRRGSVVRRCDPRRRRPRLHRRESQHSARHRACATKAARPAAGNTPGGCSAATGSTCRTCCTVRTRASRTRSPSSTRTRKRDRTARRSPTARRTASSCCGASAGRWPATSATCGRSRASRGNTTRWTRRPA